MALRRHRIARCVVGVNDRAYAHSAARRRGVRRYVLWRNLLAGNGIVAALVALWRAYRYLSAGMIRSDASLGGAAASQHIMRRGALAQYLFRAACLFLFYYHRSFCRCAP